MYSRNHEEHWQAQIKVASSKEIYLGSWNIFASKLSQVFILCVIDEKNHTRNKEVKNLLSFVCNLVTEEEATRAYDIGAIHLKGVNALTNFEISDYL